MTDLLPANSTAVERAISDAMAREDAIETPANLMWDPARIPAAYLPWLAWGASVDHWDTDWPEAQQRAAIAAAPDWHRIKGTRPSVQIALGELGHADAVVIEDRDLPRYGDEIRFGDAGLFYGPDDPSWADYWIRVPTSITYPQADRIADRMLDTAPARCRLRAIEITAPHYPTYGAAGLVYGPDHTFGGIFVYGDDNG